MTYYDKIIGDVILQVIWFHEWSEHNIL